MVIQFNEKNGIKTDVVKQLICKTLDIIEYTGFVFDGTSTRAKEQMAMVCLALANIKSTFQEATAGNYLTSKEIIKYWNEFLGDTMSTGSYDSVRDNAVKKLVDFRIVLSRAEQESLTKNSSTAGYTLAESFISLMKSYDTDEKETALSLFIDEKNSLIDSIPDKKSENENDSCHLIHQQIYYGAPGTGKSHIVNKKTEGESVIRTTFHPDSDYSTFVGAYKPTMGLLPICDELGQPMKIGSTMLHKEQIIYEFVEQAFLQAYVQAWKNIVFRDGKKQYLVIEEINRGNCAQIFGDLFQLLDRNDYGFSVYPIYADKDMQKFLKKAFARTDEPDKQIFLQDEEKQRINQLYKGNEDVISKVFAGEILVLPDNLYIWATMNTSDQSLFPIDSAFKRRWDWKYMPIGKGFDENGHEIRWAIEGETKKFDWWSFLEKINAQIGEATQSEDKKLGFFFCKATDGVISADKFVGKVIFYLWNDVFKMNGFDGPIFKDEDGTELSFGKFYESDMKGNAIVQKDKVELFLTNLDVEVFEGKTTDNEPVNVEADEDGVPRVSDTNLPYRVTFPDGEVICKGNGWETYIASLQKIGLEKALPFGDIYSRLKKTLPLITKQKIADHGVYKYHEVDGYYVLSGTDSQHLLLKRMNKDLNLGMTIE